MTTAPTDTDAPPKPFEGILLEQPIKRGDQLIDRLTLRRPSAGEMRGLQLQPLQQGDVNTLLALLPRIAVPIITQAEAEGLSMVDIAQLAGEVTGFFMSQAERSLIAKVMGQIEQGDIDRLIAVIAFIFHWPLSEMDRMSVGELMRWHDLAVERWNHANTPKDK